MHGLAVLYVLHAAGAGFSPPASPNGVMHPPADPQQLMPFMDSPLPRADFANPADEELRLSGIDDMFSSQTYSALLGPSTAPGPHTAAAPLLASGPTSDPPSPTAPGPHTVAAPLLTSDPASDPPSPTADAPKPGSNEALPESPGGSWKMMADTFGGPSLAPSIDDFMTSIGRRLGHTSGDGNCFYNGCAAYDFYMSHAIYRLQDYRAAGLGGGIEEEAAATLRTAAANWLAQHDSPTAVMLAKGTLWEMKDRGRFDPKVETYSPAEAAALRKFVADAVRKSAAGEACTALRVR